MNFFAKRRFRKSDNFIVRLAVKHFDRPTDLKNAFLELEITDEELIENVKLAIPTYNDFSPVQDDLRLALLRTICSRNPHLYSLIVDNFPEIENDFRAVQSLNFYKNKTLDFFLGIDNDDDHEYQGDNEEYFDSEKVGFEDFDPQRFSHLSTDIADDYGLIEASQNQDRTLKQLMVKIDNVLSNKDTAESDTLFRSILIRIIQRKMGSRAMRDFFVASLRSLGNADPSIAVDYGELFINSIPDHRAMRSMIIFMRKIDKIDEAIRLMYHPNFRHDQVTRDWQKQLNIRRKELILDDKLKPKFEQFGNNFDALSEFMDDLYRTMNNDLDIARYMYKYCIEVHKNIQHKPLANEVIRWGEAIFKIETETNLETDSSLHAKKEVSNKLANQRTIERYEREIRRIQQSTPMKIGLHFTNSLKNPLKLILLPIIFPIFCFNLGLEKLGYKKQQIDVLVRDEIERKNDCIVLFPTNGVGFGHFTRMYALARSIRKLSPKTEIIFFTPMPTLHILYSDNFPTYHLAGRYKHADMNARQWNGIVEEMLTLVFEAHKPKAFVFDGAYPYRGMLNAINAQEGVKKWWMRRGTFKKNRSIPNGSVESFDYTISPRDIDETNSSISSNNSVSYDVPPITLIENDEMFSREEARSLLSVPMDCKLVYVQLGAGRINDINSTINHVLNSLLTHQDVYVVLGDSLLGQRTMISMDRVRVIRDYPNALYFKGFDAAVQAGGYNSFHEMRRLHIPTVFIPNTNTGMDDQLRRVKISEKEEWGIVSKDNKSNIYNAINAMLKMEFGSPPDYPNGATIAAQLILGEMD